MDFVTKLMDSIDIGGLLAILDIQIGLGVIIAFSVFSSVISRAIIKICYLLEQNLLLRLHVIIIIGTLWLWLLHLLLILID